MNKLVYSALALSLCSVPGFASDNWASLDQELSSLSASITAQNQGGTKVGGWIITSFRASSDLQSGGNDLQGFQLDQARLEFTGDAGSDYSYKISAELMGGTASLRDAFAKFKIAEGINGKMGRYKIAFFQSALIAEPKLLFLERSGLGDIFARRDLGFELSGEFDPNNANAIRWYAGIQNGTDGQGDEHLISARIRATLMGNGPGMVEGAYGSSEDTSLAAGIAWADEGNLDDGTAIGFEVQLTSGPFYIAGEVADFDEGTGGAFGITNPVLSQWGIVGVDVADTTPWDVVGSYMFTDMYEAAVRYQDMDDDEDTTAWTAAINRYVQNKDIHWTVQWESVDTENAFGDFDVIGVGLTVAF
jgi:hypothetical protein